MSEPARPRSTSSRRRRPASVVPTRLGRRGPRTCGGRRRELPEPEPVRPVDDATALVRSLGDPPLPGNRLPAAHYLASVVERAAVLATALAASADLLEQPPTT